MLSRTKVRRGVGAGAAGGASTANRARTRSRTGGSARKSDARPRRALQAGQRTESSSASSLRTWKGLPHGLHFQTCVGGGGDAGAAEAAGAPGTAIGIAGGNFRCRIGRLGFSVMAGAYEDNCSWARSTRAEALSHWSVTKERRKRLNRRHQAGLPKFGSLRLGLPFSPCPAKRRPKPAP
jgi:hypothetical protein